MMITALLFASIILLPGEGVAQTDCDQLRSKVERLDADFLEYTALYEQDLMKEKTYLKKLKRLYKKQRELYDQARDCTFSTLAEQNWWSRARLKFPSRIALALQDMDG